MDSKKIITIIAILIIIAGVIVTAVFGFNISLQYSKHKQLDIGIGKEFDNGDIYSIAKEVVNDQVIVQKLEIYEDAVSIGVKDITDEQLEQLLTKINEKYETSNKKEDVQITEIPNVRLRELIKPYITPVIVSFVLTVIYILLYIVINNKMGKNIKLLEELVKALAIIIGLEMVYVSIIAITRIPVNTLVIPVGIIVYAISTIVVLQNLDSKYKKIEK